MIRANGIIKSYGNGESRFQVLQGISLEIEDRDFVVILGASGSGKSTFLNVISGLERPDSGKVFYDGIDITELSDCELTAFRTFRDTWLCRQPGGEALIKEYYHIAPPIVSAIDSRLDNASIYRSIWEKYLIPCLRYLESGQYEKCKMCYVTMVKTLKGQYQ